MAKTTLKLKKINIEEFGYHLIANIRINNKISKMVVDTGASQTVFNINSPLLKNNYKQTQKGKNKTTGIGSSQIDTFVLNINTLKLGRLIIENINTVGLDLNHINESYLSINQNPIDGILGGDILNKYNAIINYKKNTIQFEY